MSCGHFLKITKGRSREGAWIEMLLAFAALMSASVAPARERGLKSAAWLRTSTLRRRSREGAWIEIAIKVRVYFAAVVAPARERGLKSRCRTGPQTLRMSLPRGSVD